MSDSSEGTDSFDDSSGIWAYFCCASPLATHCAKRLANHLGPDERGKAMVWDHGQYHCTCATSCGNLPISPGICTFSAVREVVNSAIHSSTTDGQKLSLTTRCISSHSRFRECSVALNFSRLPQTNAYTKEEVYRCVSAICWTTCEQEHGKRRKTTCHNFLWTHCLLSWFQTSHLMLLAYEPHPVSVRCVLLLCICESSSLWMHTT